LKAKDAVDVLLKSLDLPDNVARRDILVALGRIGDVRAAETLSKDLYNDSPDVRAAAAEALAVVGNGVQREALEALKGDYYRRVRESAQTALEHLAANPEPPK
jgi:HEAT repeat protein